MKNIVQLKQWLFNKPAIFSLMLIGLVLGLGLIYSFIQSLLHFDGMMIHFYLIFGVSFLYSAYYMIKHLPHEKINRNDFIAITNGASIISVVSSIAIFSAFELFGPALRYKAMMFYLLHPVLLGCLLFVFFLFASYVLGVAVSGFYAKYKRATTLGIAQWKVILSMPFTFLMLWTPGYLIEEKSQKSNLLIKSKWYSRFNKWTLSNFTNTLFIFLFLLFMKAAIAGLTTLILTVVLLAFYTLWYTKHKSDFMRNINNGYALTNICINIAILLAVIIF